MVGQSLTAEMDHLAGLAEIADRRRETLAEIQHFLKEIADSGRARATATLLDDTIDIRICLTARAAADQADTAPPPVTTEKVATPAGVNAAIDDGAEPDAGDMVTSSASDVPEAQAIVEPPAPQVDVVQEDPSPVGKVADAQPAPKGKKKRPFKRLWDADRELKLARLKLAGVPWSAIADRMGATSKACQVRWQMIKARPDILALDGPLASPNRRDAGTRKTWAAHLAQLGNADPWTVEMDLRLTSYMAKDMGVGSAAALLRIKRDHVAMRWHLLSATKFQFDIEGLRDALCERIAQPSSGAEA